MSTEILRDGRDIKIGETRDVSGKLVLRNARGIKRGEYDQRTNTTRDERGLIFGTGNLLAALLCRTIGNDFFSRIKNSG